ncbi:MAG: hypothetical protein J3Q66DRAFT_336504 [Benniella sp.]|nr:MAG: hypothetical protein J3Q66DRAFT_336504 [Benniella sp.]
MPRNNNPLSLHVSGFRDNTRPSDLAAIFEPFGKISDIYIPKDYYTGRPRGFAYIQYYEDSDARNAFDSLKDPSLDGRQLILQWARGNRKSPHQMKNNPQERGRSRSTERRYRPSSRRYSRSRSRSPAARRSSRSPARRRSRSNSRTRSYHRRRSPSPARARNNRRSFSPPRRRSRSPRDRERTSPRDRERTSPPPREGSPHHRHRRSSLKNSNDGPSGVSPRNNNNRDYSSSPDRTMQVDSDLPEQLPEKLFDGSSN